MSTCDTCQYCVERSNKNKGAKLHTIHWECLDDMHPVNPTDTCSEWEERKGKMRIIFKNGEIGDVEE